MLEPASAENQTTVAPNYLRATKLGLILPMFHQGLANRFGPLPQARGIAGNAPEYCPKAICVSECRGKQIPGHNEEVLAS